MLACRGTSSEAKSPPFKDWAPLSLTSERTVLGPYICRKAEAGHLPLRQRRLFFRSPPVALRAAADPSMSRARLRFEGVCHEAEKSGSGDTTHCAVGSDIHDIFAHQLDRSQAENSWLKVPKTFEMHFMVSRSMS